MKTRGFILINVLVIIAALSVVALGVVQIPAQSVARQQAGRDLIQARLALDAGVLFAAQLLRQDALTGVADHPGEPWALSGFAAETALGPVTIHVSDLESRMNVNLLLGRNPDAAQAAIATLLQDAGIEAGLAAALITRYANQNVPQERGTQGEDADDMFQAADMTHLAGLAGLPGWDDRQTDAVASRVATLPRERRINVNTADDTVLAALPGMTPAALRTLNAKRNAAPLTERATLDTLLQDLNLTDPLSDLLDISAQWFAVDTRVSMNGLTYHGQSILRRDANTGDTRIHAQVVEVDG